MRISMTQIFLGILFTCASFAKNVKGQEILNKEISININQGQIKQILAEIQQLTSVNFVYSSTVIKAQRKVSVNAVNKRLGQILDETLNPLNIYYKVEDNQILLYEKENTGLLSANQNLITVKGKVSSDKGESLPGVSVNIKGTKIGTTTDSNGSYAITAPGPDVTLVFSYIGFTAKEIPLNGRTVLNVQLIEELTSLGEVVVVGYGTQRKKRSDQCCSCSQCWRNDQTANLICE